MAVLQPTINKYQRCSGNSKSTQWYWLNLEAMERMHYIIDYVW